MDDTPRTDPPLSTPRQALLVTRAIWAAMLLGQVVFMTVVVVIWNTGNRTSYPPQTIQLLLLINTVTLVTMIPMGYVLRSQIYKRGWQESVITPPAYLTGNLVLLSLCEGVSLFGLVVTFLNGSLWPTIIPSVVAMAVQAINFPNGLPMQSMGPLVNDPADGSRL